MKTYFRKAVLLIVMVPCIFIANAQTGSVGVGTNTPDPSAILHVNAPNNNKGVLLPQIKLLSVTDVVTIANPATSLLVFNINPGIVGGKGTGFYYFSGPSGSPANTWLFLASSSPSGNPGSPVAANNGLTATSNTVQLGGALIKPTTIATDATNTLTITGLQPGNTATDSILVSEAGTGIIKKIPAITEINGLKKVVYTATTGQLDYTTPLTIASLEKIHVYRNGVNIEFTQISANQIRLTLDAAAPTTYTGDEIKIYQYLY